MKIIEYSDAYAQKVADMWNMSRESWGNDDSIKTKEDVILQERSNGNIKLYLALDNDQVVGYCSFSQYQHDEGASYLPLLNVRPDYHGKKVGKALILKVLQDAIESKWPRFDLFTWSGNIKAMPLYKKCGFFWERKSSGVHLMNFIPYIMQSEALQEYMNDIDWYHDSKRIIDMDQDGINHKGFELYKYTFENSNHTAVFEFEKTGRGLRYVETDDYIIEINLEKSNYVYKATYPFSVRVINKSNKELHIRAIGKNDKVITTNMDFDGFIIKEEIIEGRFYVDEMVKPQDKEKTHPLVEVDLRINGKLLRMKTGVLPKSPLEVKLIIQPYYHKVGSIYTGYLDLENNLESETDFTINITNQYIDSENVNISLESKEKRSIPFTYKVLGYGFISSPVSVTYLNQTIHKDIYGIIKGTNDDFNGIDQKNAYLVSGNFVCVFDKEHRYLLLLNHLKQDVKTVFLAPQIGLPFSVEFSTITPNIEFVDLNSMEINYKSQEFPEMGVKVFVEHKSGIISLAYELYNEGDTQIKSLMIPLFTNVGNTYIPYKKQILKLSESEGGGLGSLHDEFFDERWIYNYEHKQGITWEESENLRISGWKLASTSDEIILQKGESYKSGLYRISYVHPNLESFREFAGYTSQKEEMNFIEYNVNGHNPFTDKEVSISIVNHRKKEMNGTLFVDGKSSPLTQNILTEPGLHTIKIDTLDRLLTTKRLSFKTQGSVLSSRDKNKYIIDNGQIRFACDMDYSDALYSLRFDDQEWLDSNYPNPVERVWWGTFSGGINQRVEGQQDHNVLPEERHAEFVGILDNYKQIWNGIKVSIIFEKTEDFKGYIFDTYYVTQPAFKGLISFSVIHNKTGKFIANKGFHKFITIKADSDPKDVYFKHDGITYKCGNKSVEKTIKKLLTLESKRNYKMSIFNKDSKLLMETQTGYTICFSEHKVDIPDLEKVVMPIDFIFFTKEDLKAEYLKDFETIKFEV